MAVSVAKVVHVSIARDCRAVYRFASRPEAMPRWASGLAMGLEKADEDWVAHGPLGAIRICFSADNAYGVLDHTVFLPSGAVVYNALRVIPNGDGAEIMFTLFRETSMSDEQFAADAAWVEKDLRALKALMENHEDDT